MDVANALLLILAGILAISGLILAKKPDAKPMIDKLVPFQALIGIAVLVLGLANLIRSLDGLMNMFHYAAFYGSAERGRLDPSRLLGFLFGMTQFAKRISGELPTYQK